jgi:hypothetical protein
VLSTLLQFQSIFLGGRHANKGIRRQLHIFSRGSVFPSEDKLIVIPVFEGEIIDKFFKIEFEICLSDEEIVGIVLLIWLS